jgi:hypothetical protein
MESSSDIDALTRVVELSNNKVACGVEFASLDVMDACFVKRFPARIRYQFLRWIRTKNIVDERIAVGDERDMVGGGICDVLNLVCVVIARCQVEQIHMRYVDHIARW